MAQQDDKDKYKHDLYQFSEKISDHITDRVYKHFESEEKKFADNTKSFEELIDKYIDEAIEENLTKEIPKIISNEISKRIESDLTEQYRPQNEWEKRIDKYIISWPRWIMAAVYGLLSVVLICIFWYALADIINLFFTMERDVVFIVVDDWEHFVDGWEHLLFDKEIDNKSKDGKVNSLDSLIGPTVKILDLVLVGSLVVMVLIGGYENTVSRIGMKHSMPTWLGKLNISQLKIKVAASIIIISSIHLLMSFLKIDLNDHDNTIEHYYPLILTSVIHIVFILSALAITYIDKISHSHKEHGSENKSKDQKTHQLNANINLSRYRKRGRQSL